MTLAPSAPSHSWRIFGEKRKTGISRKSSRMTGVQRCLCTPLSVSHRQLKFLSPHEYFAAQSELHQPGEIRRHFTSAAIRRTYGADGSLPSSSPSLSSSPSRPSAYCTAVTCASKRILQCASIRLLSTRRVHCTLHAAHYMSVQNES